MQQCITRCAHLAATGALCAALLVRRRFLHTMGPVYVYVCGFGWVRFLLLSPVLFFLITSQIVETGVE